MAVLGLRFCARAFSSCSKWGPLFIAVRGPLTITASLVAEHRLHQGSPGPFLKSLLNLLQYCLFYVLVFWPQGMWDLSSPTRNWTGTPCIGRQSLNHWTAREVPTTHTDWPCLQNSSGQWSQITQHVFTEFFYFTRQCNYLHRLTKNLSFSLPGYN